MRNVRVVASAWAAMALGLAVLAGCEKASPPPTLEPVTAAEAQALAAQFGAAFSPCEAERLAGLIDAGALVRRAVEASQLTAPMRREVLRGMTNAQIASRLCQGVDDEATYVLLRINEVDGQPRPLFRLLNDDAVNYHELELGKSPKDQQVRVVDIRIYASGDLLSASLTQVFDQVALAKKLGRSPAELARAVEALNRARANGDAEEVQRRFAELPAELRDSKPLRLAELMSGADLEPAAYSAIMERYRQDFPGDPSIDMVAVDYFFLKKDLPRTLEAIETVDRRVAGDPYLNVLRANAHLNVGQAAEAIVAARAAVTAEPNLEPGWWALVMAQLRRGDHDAVAETVATLNLRFKAGIASDTVEDVALWGPYFASEAYWRSLGNGRPRPAP